MAKRSALYVDGFNLYHAINDLGEPHLKWLDLQKLGHTILPSQSETLVQVTYCTAFYPSDPKKTFRHNEYLIALKLVGVNCVMGHYIYEDAECQRCGNAWQKPTEKETDINLAMHLICDAWKDKYDKAYLVTADSDHGATARAFHQNFADKELVTVAPPGREFSRSILNFANGKIKLTKDVIERSLFPPIVFKEGERAARMPREYAPPTGWVAPK
jgi:hypothetical protein